MAIVPYRCGAVSPIRYEWAVMWTLVAVALVLIELAALCMVALGLPGTWVQVAVAGAIAWTMDAGGRSFLAIVALAVAGELVELASARWGAQRFGGSRRAAWGALAGGFAGLFVGVPVPIVGPLVTSFVGTFAGAIVGEMWGRGLVAPELRIGLGAVIGRAVGVGVKLGIAMAIALLTLAGLFWGGG